MKPALPLPNIDFTQEEKDFVATLPIAPPSSCDRDTLWEWIESVWQYPYCAQGFNNALYRHVGWRIQLFMDSESRQREHAKTKIGRLHKAFADIDKGIEEIKAVHSEWEKSKEDADKNLT